MERFMNSRGGGKAVMTNIFIYGDDARKWGDGLSCDRSGGRLPWQHTVKRRENMLIS